MSHSRMFSTQDKRSLMIKQTARINVRVLPIVKDDVDDQKNVEVTERQMDPKVHSCGYGRK